MTSEDMKDLADRKLRQEVLERFVEEITTNKIHREEADRNMEVASARSQSASVRGLWNLAYIVYDKHEETLMITKAIFEVVFAIFDGYSERIAKIEKEMQTIAENTGTDISKVKTDVDQLKETVGPKVNAVIQLFANLQKEEERKKKNGEKMVV